MLRLKFDNEYIPNDDIKGLDEFTTTLIFEDEQNVFRLKTESKFELIGTTYSYIYNKVKNASCNRFDFVIEDSCDGIYYPFFIGYVYASDIVFKRNKCTAVLELIKDDSYSGIINALQDNSINTFAKFSPDCFEVSINQYLVDYFDINGSYIYTNRKSYKWQDLLGFLVAYYSNGTIDFQTNVTEEIYITNGYNLRAQTGRIDLEYFAVNFFDIYNNLRKLLNLALVIEYDAFGKPIIKVVYKDYLYSGGLIKSLTDDEVSFDFDISLDKSRQYNSVQLGSDDYELNDSANDNWNDENPMEAWQKRELTTCSDCLSERGNVLNLVSTFVIDSDVILEVLAGDDSRDENIFLIEGDYLNTKAVLYGIPYLVFHYNRIFINQSVIDRYGNDINCFIKNSLGGENTMVLNGNESAVGLYTGGSGFIGFDAQTNYINEISYNSVIDNGNNCVETLITGGDSGFSFIVPSNGLYSFQFSGTYGEISNIGVIDCEIAIAIRVYASGSLPYVGASNHIYESLLLNNNYDYLDGLIPFNLLLSENLNAGDIVVCFHFAKVFFPPNPNGLNFQIGVKDFEFKFVDCAGDLVQTDSINDKPYLANFSFLQTSKEFYDLSRSSLRYGYYRYKGSKLWVKEIENDGCQSKGVFYMDSLPEC
jgi:hypothetical protein